MATEQEQICISLEAAHDLSAFQYCVAGINAAGRVAVGGADGTAIGILQNKAGSLCAAKICIAGLSKVRGTGSINEGDWLCCGHGGKVVATTTSKDVTIGQVVTATGGGTETRYSIGDLSSAAGEAWNRNLLGSWRFFLNNGSETFCFAMTNIVMTKIGDVKPTGADGHFEVDFEAECLPKDGAIEFKD